MEKAVSTIAQLLEANLEKLSDKVIQHERAIPVGAQLQEHCEGNEGDEDAENGEKSESSSSDSDLSDSDGDRDGERNEGGAGGGSRRPHSVARLDTHSHSSKSTHSVGSHGGSRDVRLRSGGMEGVSAARAATAPVRLEAAAATAAGKVGVRDDHDDDADDDAVGSMPTGGRATAPAARSRRAATLNAATISAPSPLPSAAAARGSGTGGRETSVCVSGADRPRRATFNTKGNK